MSLSVASLDHTELARRRIHRHRDRALEMSERDDRLTGGLRRHGPPHGIVDPGDDPAQAVVATAGVTWLVIGQFENVARKGDGGPVPSRQAAKKTVIQRDIEEDARRSPALPLRPFACTFGTALTQCHVHRPRPPRHLPRDQYSFVPTVVPDEARDGFDPPAHSGSLMTCAVPAVPPSVRRSRSVPQCRHRFHFAQCIGFEANGPFPDFDVLDGFERPR